MEYEASNGSGKSTASSVLKLLWKAKDNLWKRGVAKKRYIGGRGQCSLEGSIFLAHGVDEDELRGWNYNQEMALCYADDHPSVAGAISCLALSAKERYRIEAEDSGDFLKDSFRAVENANDWHVLSILDAVRLIEDAELIEVRKSRKAA